MTQEEQEQLIFITRGLLDNIRAHMDKHGAEYCGGLPLQFAITDLKRLGIDTSPLPKLRGKK